MTAPRPALRVGAYAVVERDGAVLLARWIGSDPAVTDPATTHPPRAPREAAAPRRIKRWTLPGGGLDHGEDPRDGAVREVEEETGYVVRLGRVLTVESFRELVHRRDGPLDHQAICVIYAAEVVGGELRDEIGGSTDTAAWFPLAAVPTLTRGGLVDLGLAAAGHLPAGADGAVG